MRKGFAVSEERSGAGILVESLVRQGVEYVFGYPGGAVLPIYDALFGSITTTGRRAAASCSLTNRADQGYASWT